MNPATKSIHWETPEYHHEVKSSDWYVTVWIVAATIAIAAILLQNLTFGILVVFSTLALTLTATRAPSLIQCSLTSEGVHSGRTLYPFASLESFGIDLHNIHYPKLIIKSRKTLMPFIIIPLENADVPLVREYMRAFLTEDDHIEPLAHKLFDYLGF